MGQMKTKIFLSSVVFVAVFALASAVKVNVVFAAGARRGYLDEEYLGIMRLMFLTLMEMLRDLPMGMGLGIWTSIRKIIV